MKRYKYRNEITHPKKEIKTMLLASPLGTSYKFILKYGDNYTEKIFEGKDAYKRAILFQNNFTDFINTL